MGQNKNTKRLLIALVILILLFILGWFFLACNPVIALWLDRIPQRCQYNFIPISLTPTSTPAKPSTPTAPVVIKGEEVNTKPAIISFAVSPNPRKEGEYSYLSWQSANTKSCRLNGGRFSNTLVEVASSSVPVAPEVPERTFTLTCFNGVGGQGTSSASASVLVKSIFSKSNPAPSPSVNNDSIYSVTNGASQDVKIIRRVAFSGQLLKEWQVKSDNGEVLQIFGINFINPNEDLIILAFTPSLSWLETFSPDGVSKNKVILPTNGLGKIIAPKDISKDNNGNIYILQGGANSGGKQFPAVIKISARGQFIKSFGLANSIPGKSGSQIDSIGEPVSMAVIGSNLYVSDHGFVKYVHRFNLEGNYLSYWGKECVFSGSNVCQNVKPVGYGVFDYPWLGQKANEQNYVYLQEGLIPLAPGTARFDNTATNFIQKFDLTGKFLAHVVTRKGSSSYTYKLYLGPCCSQPLTPVEGSYYLFGIGQQEDFYLSDSLKRTFYRYSAVGQTLNTWSYDTLLGKGKIGDILTVAAN